MAAPTLVLASTSPRRSELLRAAGIPFVIREPGPEPVASGAPIELAQARARAKATSARVAPGDELVLGVDTVVDLDGRELGKPADRREAAAMLRMLAGRIHDVHTGHCLWSPRTGRVTEEVASARVRCRAPLPQEIECYLEGGEWRGKAGSYGIQDPTQSFLTLHAGSFDTVVGLCIDVVRRLLQRAGSP